MPKSKRTTKIKQNRTRNNKYFVLKIIYTFLNDNCFCLDIYLYFFLKNFLMKYTKRNT